MPDGSLVPGSESKTPSVDELALYVIASIATNATRLEALDAFGVRVLLVPRTRLLGKHARGHVTWEDDGPEMMLEVLPTSRASVDAFEEIARLAICDVAVAEVTEDERPPMALVHAVAARVLEMRGPLREDDAESWRPLVRGAVEIGRELRRRREALLAFRARLVAHTEVDPSTSPLDFLTRLDLDVRECPGSARPALVDRCVLVPPRATRAVLVDGAERAIESLYRRQTLALEAA